MILPLLILAITILCAAMALPRAYISGDNYIDGGRISNQRRHEGRSPQHWPWRSSGGERFNSSTCKSEGLDCRQTGKCRLENTGFVCCCEHCTPRIVHKSSKVICGDDGVTYESYCELKRQQCTINKSIGIKNKGPCVKRPQRCNDLRQNIILKQTSGDERKGYVPTCDSRHDWLFDTIQCSRDDGLKCWCVMPETNINITEPVYVKSKKDFRNDCEVAQQTIYGKCMLAKRAVVQDQNVINGCEPCRILEQLFTAFRKVGTESTIVSNSLTKKRNSNSELEMDIITADRLFKHFDRDNDGQLSRGELEIVARWQDLNKLCVLNTFSLCDTNDDESTSRLEWCACLMVRCTSTG